MRVHFKDLVVGKGYYDNSYGEIKRVARVGKKQAYDEDGEILLVSQLFEVTPKLQELLGLLAETQADFDEKEDAINQSIDKELGIEED